MVDYNRAIKRPFTDIKKLLIGTVLQLIPVVNLIAIGYYLNCAKTAMKKEFVLPEWGEWGDLFAKGLMFLIAGIVYMVPAVAILVIGMGASFVGGGMGAMMSGSKAAWGPALVTMGLSALAAFLFGLLGAYFLPSAMLNYANGGKFGNFFAFKAICKKAAKTEYLTVWLFSVVYGIAAAVVLSVVPIVGSALGMFVAGVTSYTLFGELYEKL